MTVTGTSAPSSANTWVIPTFLPMIPSIAISFTLEPEGSCECPVPSARCPVGMYWALGTVHWALFSLSERLDLHIHTCGKLELHERVDGLRRRLENVEQPLV